MIELAMDEEEVAALEANCRSRSGPASRVERARILLAYWKNPSLSCGARAMGYTTRRPSAALSGRYGPMAALDDRPRAGTEPTIIAVAKDWIGELAYRKASELGYPSNCGRRAFSPAMRASTGRRRGIAISPSWLRHLAREKAEMGHPRRRKYTCPTSFAPNANSGGSNSSGRISIYIHIVWRCLWAFG
jgi:hypothetical protein